MKAFLMTLALALGMLAAQAQPEVYICTGPKSLRYHKTSDCRGLGRCSGTVKAVSLEQAQQIGRTPCKICYGR